MKIVYDNYTLKDQINCKVIPDTVKSLKLYRVWGYLAYRDLHSRYRNSWLGCMWLLIHFLSYMGVVAIIFSQVFKQPLETFFPHLFWGVLVFDTLRAGIIGGGQTFLSAQGYITQIPLPKQVYLFRSLYNQFLDFAIKASTFLLFVPFLHYENYDYVNSLFGFLAGMVFLWTVNLLHISIFAYMNALVKDIGHVAQSVIQILYWMTPVIYTEQMLKQSRLGVILDFNPLCWFIRLVRTPVLEGCWSISYNYLLCSIYILIMSLVALIITAKFEKKLIYRL